MDNLFDKIFIAIEKFIFGDSIIERVNQTLKEVNDEDSKDTTHRE